MLFSSSTLLALALSATTLPLASAAPSGHRRSNSNLLQRRRHHSNVNLLRQNDNDRRHAYTATTTVTVEMTSTQTIWDVVTVEETASATSDLAASASTTASASLTDSWSSSATATPIATGANSTVPTGSATESASVSSWSSASSLPALSASATDSFNATYVASVTGTASASTVTNSTTSVGAQPLPFNTWLVNGTTVVSAVATASATETPSASSIFSSAAAGHSASVSASSSPEASATESSSSTGWGWWWSTQSESASATESAPSSSATAASSTVSAGNATHPATASQSATTAASSTYTPWWAASSSASQSSSAFETLSSSSSSFATASASETASATASESASANVSSTSDVLSATASATLSASVSSSSSVSASSTSSSSAASASSTGLTTTELNERMMVTYYPDWTTSTLPPASIDWDLYDCVDYAFAIPDSSYGLSFTDDDSAETLKSVVSYGHAAGKKVRLSVGGWTGSTYFSDAVASEDTRSTFANNILSVYNEYDLDGIDIDWEYPGVQGAGTNSISSSDSANFILFLNTLRQTLPSTAIISAAAQVWPFADADGNPMTDVSAFAEVLDWVLIMNYDVWGSSSTPGPNAPLSDGCNDSLQPLANAYSAVSSWTTAGMPASQLMLGVPAYGYIQKSTATKLVDRAETVTVYNSDGGSTDGQVDFRDLVSQGVLELASNGSYIGSGGFTREWDSCSSTPWLKSTSSGQIVTYDDPDSLSLKAQFARQAGLRGCNMWDMSGDTASWSLTAALRSGLGL